MERLKYFVKLACFILFASTVVLASSQKLIVKQILKNPEKYDRKVVKVEGTVIRLKFKTSKKGNRYVTFSLMDEDGNTLKVFMWGYKKIKKEGIKNGDKAEVTGIFYKVKRVGKYRFYNEIDAKTIKKN